MITIINEKKKARKLRILIENHLFSSITLIAALKRIFYMRLSYNTGDKMAASFSIFACDY